MTWGGRNAYPEALQKRAVSLCNQGMSNREVADLLGVSRSAVSTWVRDRRAARPPVETPEAVKLLQRVMAAWRTVE